MLQCLTSFVALAGFAVTASAQCSLDWQPGLPVPGPAGLVHALVELPNGELIAGGTFTAADAASVDRIAFWDGASWKPFGAAGGADGPVFALAVLPGGELVAGGSFDSVGGVGARAIARLGTNGWQPIGAGLGAQAVVQALLTLPNGDLVAGGIDMQGGGSAPFVARWDGASWQSLVGGAPLPASGFVSDLAQAANGDLVAVGSMALRWNGVAWSQIPAVGPGTWVSAVVPLPNGDLAFATDSGVVRFDGTNTVTLGATGSDVLALARLPDGTLVAGGFFASIGGQAASRIAAWNGVTWSPLGAGRTDPVRSLLVRADGRLVAGGGRFSIDFPFPYAVGEWDNGWTDLGGPTPGLAAGQIACFQRLPNGDLLAAGSFERFGAQVLRRVARWDGAGWHALGSGFDDGRVAAAAVAPSGDIVVVGSFTAAGGVPMPGAARWNGTSWSAIGNGVPPGPISVAVADGGAVFVAHTGGVSAWDGTAWIGIGSPGTVLRLAWHEGALIGGGVCPGSNVQRWDGNWSPMGAVTGAVAALLVTRSGELVLGKDGGDAVQRWDGTVWQLLGGVNCTSLAEFANGDLIANGATFGDDAAARWTGSAWQPLGDGTDTLAFVGASGHGDVFLHGSLVAAGGSVAAYLARATATCPAGVQSLGVACSGSAGAVSLSAETGPWIGTTFRAEAAGLPAQALSLHVLGAVLAPVPLPLAPAGCDWFVDPVFLQPLLPVGGAAVAAQLIPFAPSLIGATSRAQVLVLEFDTFGAWTQTAASAALQLTFGAL